MGEVDDDDKKRQRQNIQYSYTSIYMALSMLCSIIRGLTLNQFILILKYVIIYFAFITWQKAKCYIGY